MLPAKCSLARVAESQNMLQDKKVSLIRMILKDYLSRQTFALPGYMCYDAAVAYSRRSIRRGRNSEANQIGVLFFTLFLSPPFSGQLEKHVQERGMRNDSRQNNEDLRARLSGRVRRL